MQQLPNVLCLRSSHPLFSSLPRASWASSASGLFTSLLLFFSSLTALTGQHSDHCKVVTHLYISSLRPCKHSAAFSPVSPTNSCPSGEQSRSAPSLFREIESALFLQHVTTQQQRSHKDTVFTKEHRRLSTTWKTLYSLPRTIRFPGNPAAAITDPAVTYNLLRLQPGSITPTLPLKTSTVPSTLNVP